MKWNFIQNVFFRQGTGRVWFMLQIGIKSSVVKSELAVKLLQAYIEYKIENKHSKMENKHNSILVRNQHFFNG